MAKRHFHMYESVLGSLGWTVEKIMNVVGLHFATRNMTLVRPYFILLYNQMASEMKEWVRPPDLMRSYSHNIKYLLKRGQNTLQSSHHS